MPDQAVVTDEMVGRNANLGAILPGLRRRFEELYGGRLVKLVLYGSQARGEAHKYSDIDILVVLKGPVHPGQEIERTGESVSGLSLEYDAVIQCLFLDEEQYAAAESPLVENVAREGVEI